LIESIVFEKIKKKVDFLTKSVRLKIAGVCGTGDFEKIKKKVDFLTKSVRVKIAGVCGTGDDDKIL